MHFIVQNSKELLDVALLKKYFAVSSMQTGTVEIYTLYTLDDQVCLS